MSTEPNSPHPAASPSPATGRTCTLCGYPEGHHGNEHAFSPEQQASPSPGEQERPVEALNELVNRIWRETKSVGLGITLPEWKALCACDISKYCASTTAGLTAAAEQHAKEMEQGNTLVNEIENRLSNAEAAQQEAEQALAAEVEAHNFTKIALQHHETARLAASEREELKQAMQATIDTNREMKEEAIQAMNLADQRCEQWRGIADRLALCLKYQIGQSGYPTHGEVKQGHDALSAYRSLAGAGEKEETTT